MPRARTSLAAGAPARTLLALPLAVVLAVAFALVALDPAAGAPLPAETRPPAQADSHSDCTAFEDELVPELRHASFTKPQEGWPNYDPAQPFSTTNGAWVADGAFSTWLGLHRFETRHHALDFEDAWPLVAVVLITTVDPQSNPPAFQTEAHDYRPELATGGYGLTGATFHEIVEVEFCYVPPPDHSPCPDASTHFALYRPAGGWPDADEPTSFGDDTFSVVLTFYSTDSTELDNSRVDFSSAEPPVTRLYAWAWEYQSWAVAERPGEGAVYDPPAEADSGIEPSWASISYIEFCYVTPTPTLPPATPTLPPATLPPATPTLPPATPTLPLPTPTLSLPTPTLPLPTPTPPRPTATPTEVPTAPPTPTPSPTVPPTEPPTPTPTGEPTAPASPSPSPPAEPTVAPTVEPSAAPTDPPEALGRFFGAIPPAAQVSMDPGAIAFSLLLVVLFLLLALFPASLFNETIEENYEVIAGWFARGGRRAARLRGLMSRFWHGWFGVSFFMLLSGVIYGFLDPAFGLDADSVALFLGIVAGLAITTAAFELPIVLVQRRVNLERGVVRVLPLTILIALACVLVSRIAEFQPGYLYGLVAFWAFERGLPRRSAGVAVALTSVLILLMALGAWMLLPAVEGALAGAPLLLTFVGTLLAVIFIGGLEGLLVELVPVRFLRGQHVWAWRRSVWLMLFLVGGFAFVHILLHPGVDYVFEARGAAVAVAVAFFIGFGALSVITWGYFRYFYRARAA